MATLSLAAAIITLFLIKLLKKWNGYLLLVCSLTVCQAIYDIGFLLLPWYSIAFARVLYFFLSTLGGLTATLWSNVIILLLCRIVYTLDSTNILKQVKEYHFYLSFNHNIWFSIVTILLLL